MPLNWNIGDCKDHDKLNYCTNPSAPEDEREYRLMPLTEGLIWVTIAIGIAEITEKNYKDFYTRMRFAEALNGQMVHKWDFEAEDHVDYTVDDIKRHIGLGTNASTKTKAEFVKGQIRMWEDSNGKLK